MPWVGFEPPIPALERAKTVHALDRAATVIGKSNTEHFWHRYSHEHDVLEVIFPLCFNALVCVY
jgi:hypothetical protein